MTISKERLEEMWGRVEVLNRHELNVRSWNYKYFEDVRALLDHIDELTTQRDELQIEIGKWADVPRFEYWQDRAEKAEKERDELVEANKEVRSVWLLRKQIEEATNDRDASQARVARLEEALSEARDGLQSAWETLRSCKDDECVPSAGERDSAANYLIAIESFLGPRHKSDCALHNGPAETPKPCDCEAQPGLTPEEYGSEFPKEGA